MGRGTNNYRLLCHSGRPYIDHTKTNLRSARRQTVRAKCKAALLFPPDCGGGGETVYISATGTRKHLLKTCAAYW